MKIGKSIVSGAKARDLLEDLRLFGASNPNHRSSGEFRQLRYCARYSKRDKWALKSNSVVFFWHVEFAAGFSLMNGRTRRYLPNDERVEDRLSRLLYKLIRAEAVEQLRVEAVQKADALATPLQADPAFQTQVELWEKQDGKWSDYQTMTVEEAERWVQRIEGWKAVCARSSGVSSIKLCEAQA